MQVRLWDVATGVNDATLNHNRALHCVATPPGGGNGVVAFGGAESGLRMWDPRGQGDTVVILPGASQHRHLEQCVCDIPRIFGTLLVSCIVCCKKLFDTSAFDHVI